MYQKWPSLGPKNVPKNAPQLKHGSRSNTSLSLKTCMSGFLLLGKRRVSLLATRELNKQKASAQKLSIILSGFNGGLH